MIADGFAKGDIKNPRDLQTYCNLAKRKHDFDKEKMVCPYECAFGQRPNSALSLALHGKGKEHNAMHTSLSMEEDKYIKWMRTAKHTQIQSHRTGQIPAEVGESDEDITADGVIQDLAPEKRAQLVFTEAERLKEVSLAKREEVARDNAIRRQSNKQRPPYAYDFNISPGMEVSHTDGLLYKVVSVSPNPSNPITAEISREGHQKSARIIELKPAATPRPARHLSTSQPKIGDLAVIQCTKDGEPETVCGIVTETDDQQGMTVHVYLPTPKTMTVWLPAWSRNGDVSDLTNGSRVERKEKTPEGLKAIKARTHFQDTIMIGALTSTGRLTQETAKDMRSRGLLKWMEETDR